jgi:alpha/beta superfamily hydrolase
MAATQEVDIRGVGETEWGRGAGERNDPNNVCTLSKKKKKKEVDIGRIMV